MPESKPSKIQLADRVELYLARFLRLTLLVAVGVALFEARWSVALITLIILLLTYLHLVFEKQTKISLPLDFEFVIVVLIYASLFLGEMGDYYAKFWWWDLFLHGFSSLAMGFVGFLILYILYEKKRIHSRPVWVALFTFSFAVAAGVLWEIFEFGMDRIWGTMMQKSELDTMGDLIVDVIGAFITSFVGFFYLRGKRQGLFRRLLRRFAEENPDLF